MTMVIFITQSSAYLIFTWCLSMSVLEALYSEAPKNDKMGHFQCRLSELAPEAFRKSLKIPCVVMFKDIYSLHISEIAACK